MPKFIDDIPDEFLKSIGSVLIRWNHLEQVVNMFLIHLLGKQVLETRSHIVFADMAFQQKLDTLDALVAEVIASNHSHNLHLNAYKTKVHGLLSKSQKGRNKVVHSTYGMNNGKVTWATIHARRLLKFSWVPVTLKEIEAIAESIEIARKALSDLADPAIS